MTWVDLLLIIIWVVFVAVGARLGSLWIGSCVLGGFLGSFLADYYAHPLSVYMSSPTFFSEILLFTAGLLAIAVPGWIISKAGNILFIGVVDSAMGLVTGAIIGLVAIALGLLILIPSFPSVERSKSWKKSLLAKRYHLFIESLFNEPQFRPSKIGKKIRDKTINKVTPVADKAVQQIKDKTSNFVDKIN